MRSPRRGGTREEERGEWHVFPIYSVEEFTLSNLARENDDDVIVSMIETSLRTRMGTASAVLEGGENLPEGLRNATIAVGMKVFSISFHIRDKFDRVQVEKF